MAANCLWVNNGRAFNISLSDVPEEKSDLIQGKYQLPAPSTPTTLAVKLIDMLAEEVLVTKKL